MLLLLLKVVLTFRSLRAATSRPHSNSCALSSVTCLLVALAHTRRSTLRLDLTALVHPHPNIIHPIMAAAAVEHVEVYRIILYSPAYFAACALGGALSCGITHTLLTPIDLVKCNKQANPQLFSLSTPAALRDIYSGALDWAGYSGGLRGVFRGWGATLAGYSVPYTVIKFLSFERIASALYGYSPSPRLT